MFKAKYMFYMTGLSKYNPRLRNLRFMINALHDFPKSSFT